MIGVPVLPVKGLFASSLNFLALGLSREQNSLLNSPWNLRKKPAELKGFCPVKYAQQPQESKNSLLIPCSAGNFPPGDWFARDCVIRQRVHADRDFYRTAELARDSTHILGQEGTGGSGQRSRLPVILRFNLSPGF
jgi:hypothetical protein